VSLLLRRRRLGQQALELSPRPHEDILLAWTVNEDAQPLELLQRLERLERLDAVAPVEPELTQPRELAERRHRLDVGQRVQLELAELAKPRQRLEVRDCCVRQPQLFEVGQRADGRDVAECRSAGVVVDCERSNPRQLLQPVQGFDLAVRQVQPLQLGQR